MTEQPSAIEVPASHDTYGRVVCRIIRRVGDGDDTGTTPDALPMSGSVTFTPLTKWDRTTSYSAFASNEPVTCLLNPLTGEMMSPGQPPIVGVDLLVGPYRVSFNLDHGTLDPFNVEVKATHTSAAPLDLVHEAPYSPPPGVQHSVLVPSGITSGHLLAYSGGQIVGVDPASLGGGDGGSGPVTWDAILSKPSTFPPSTHSHSIGDVTGLQSALDGKQPATQPINARTGAYTLTASDAGKLVTVTAAAGVTVTVPAGVFTAGQRVDVLDLGAGRVTFVAGAGMTLSGTPSLVSRAQYSAHSVVFLSASQAVVVGDLGAA